jgi:tetrahydromethanopterin S-methyltransferase subunit A
MLKVTPPDGYPPEQGRYTRGNDFSPVAICVILDTFDFAISPELQELVMAGLDAGAALSGMLQTENVGLEKVICNIVANPNIRYIVLCGRESAGHLPGQSLLALKQNGVDEKNRIIGSSAPTPYLSNIPREVIDRFNKQIVTIVNLLCQLGEKNAKALGLDPRAVEKAVWSCYQESPVKFMEYTLYDMGAYPELAIVHKIASKLMQPQPFGEPGKSRMGMGLTLQKFLPNTNCKDCPFLGQPEFAADRQALVKLLE